MSSKYESMSPAELRAAEERLRQETAKKRRELSAIQKAKKGADRRERDHRLVLFGVTVEKALEAGDMDGAEFAQLIACHLSERDQAAALAGLNREGVNHE